ncbi:MAG: DNA polymerase III subunit delta' [Betaproteobacteria bacterium]|nr:DNA polymerase III subunit delta' [Betaproteobacteria bacterium]
MLIHGRRGIGKLAFAISCAEALLCEAPTGSGIPCGECTACKWLASGNHPDFRLVELQKVVEPAEENGTAKKAAVQITIDQIRMLPDFINVSSHRGGPKVILLHPAEALNVNAANALLKSLEEPPPGTFFILVSHRVHYLLPTVRSRCQELALPGPAANIAEEWLQGEGVTEPALALAQTGNAPLLARELAVQDFWQQRKILLQHISGACFDALQAAEQIRDYPLEHVVSWLQKWTFDLIFQKFLGTIRYNPDYGPVIRSLSQKIDTLGLLRFHQATVRLQAMIHHPLNPRLVLERLLLDYADLIEPGMSRTHEIA